MKAAFLIIFSIFLAMPFAARCDDARTNSQVRISQERDGDVIKIFAENVSDHSLTITVQLSDIVNAKSEGWPTKAVKRCLSGDRVLMTALIQSDGAPPAKFACTMTTSTEPPPPVNPDVGQPQPSPQSSQRGVAGADATPSPTPAPRKVLEPVDPHFGYRLPFEHGTSHTVSQGYDGLQSHRGTYAVDFDMPLGTPVCASRDGVVADLHNDRGEPESDLTIGNYVAIVHPDGTAALYAQLARADGVCVTVGQRVKAGDVIGRSGTTGHSNGPHLHFEVEALKECIGVSVRGNRGQIPVVFDIYGQKGVTLEAGNSYEAE